MAGIFVPIDRDARARLAELARTERRHPSAQAALLLERALRRGRVMPLRPTPVESLYTGPGVAAGPGAVA